jgi:hypothetical protein
MTDADQNPIDRVIGALDAHGCRPRHQGDSWMARCPAHDDREPSLAVGRGQQQPVLINCFAGCRPEDVLVALGMCWSDVCKGKGVADGDQQIIAQYVYVDEAGQPLHRTNRWSPRRFTQDRWTGTEWKPGLDDTRRVLFRLPELRAAIGRKETVYIAEGEKDSTTLVSKGVVATTNPMGAKCWRREYSEQFDGASVVLVLDDDRAGYERGVYLHDELHGRVEAIEMCLPAFGKDMTDHVVAAYTVADLVPVSVEDLHQRLAVSDDEATDGTVVPLHEDPSLLDDLAEFVGRFVAFPSPAMCNAVALWIAHAHCFAAAETTPRLSIQSAEKQSGKTRLLEVLELLVPSPLQVANISPAGLFRTISAGPITLLIDEVDAVFHPRAAGSAQDLRAMLNAGYRRGATVVRCVGDGKNMQVQPFPVFAPVALAGIGALPDTIQDRSIVLRLKRRAPGEVVAKLRRRDVTPEASQLRDRVARWCGARISILAASVPDAPEALSDRAADIWEPLFAIADLVDDSWSQRARHASLELSAAAADVEQSQLFRLLLDLHEMFEVTGRDRLRTSEILDGLHAMDESPWGDWLNSRVLAKKLRAIEVRPRAIRDGTDVFKGYSRQDLDDSFSRYLPGVAVTSVTSVTEKGQACCA